METGLPVEEELVDRKIGLLQEIVKNGQLSDRERKLAVQLLNAYTLLKQSFSKQLNNEQWKHLVLSLSQSLFSAEEAFFAGEPVATMSERETASKLLKERDSIMDLYRKGEYEGVIRECLRLRSEFGSDAVSLELGLLFALSLGEVGKLEEAVHLGEGIARQMQHSPDLPLLRDRIARWKLQLGDRNGALITCEQLRGNLEETAALVQALQAEMEKRNEDNAEAGIESEQLEPALLEVEKAREALETEKAIREAYVKTTLAAARSLVEANKFEEALQKLETIGRVEKENSEATALKDRAVEGIINRDRNKAAQLFLSARKSGDPGEKEALLASALQILAGLAEKYPSSNLKDKILSNKSRVEEELKKIRANQLQ